MSRKPRGLSDAERAHWADYASAIRPLAPRGAPSPEVPQPAGEPVPVIMRRPPPATKSPLRALTIGEAPGGVDRATWERFRSGRLQATRTLDLHGRTAQQAFHALAAFLHATQAEGLRCVEVVTGRGSGTEGGVIRREFREWLNRPDIRALVLAAVHPHPANPGSVKLLLRRLKPLAQSDRARGAERRS